MRRWRRKDLPPRKRRWYEEEDEEVYGRDIEDWDTYEFPRWRERERWRLRPFRRLGDPFSDIFEDIDREFERMERYMDDVFRKAVRGELGEPGKGGPFVYGFSMRVGPDGRPHIQEFGNTRSFGLGRFRPFRTLPRIVGAKAETEAETEPIGREPLTDIIEGEREISVTLELPGVAKEDIDLEVSEDAMSVSVDTPDRKYYKEIPLPCEVLPSSTRATYKNGVLDITVRKAVVEKKRMRKVKVK
jgi:HSP20 family protein